MPTAMRLMYVSLHTSPDESPGSGDAGGMNVVERHQAEELAELGHQVEMVTRRSAPDQPAVVELAPNLTLRYLDAGPAEVVAKSAQSAFIGEFSIRLAELDLPDLFCSQHWMSGVAALPVARAAGVPHVQSFHSVAAPELTSLFHGERPESPDRIDGEALIARESDLIVAVSEAEREIVIERCGGDPDRIVVVPPGVDAELFRPARADEPHWRLPGGIDEGGYVLLAARLHPLKAPDLAIEAVAAIDPEVRPTLVLAGSDSADFPTYAADLQRLADRLGIGDRVRHIGGVPRDELAAMMRGAHALLVTSYSETFGLVALEAAASATPCVAAAVGGLREVVVDGRTGTLVDSREPSDWATAIETYLRDPALARQVGAAARERAEGFRWDAVALRLQELYATLIEEHS